VRVPVEDLGEAGPREQAPAADGAEATAAALECEVLLVEDNPVNRRVAEAMLGDLGCEVDSVDAGEAALDALRRTTDDVVLLDIQMPGTDGFEVARRIPEVTPDGSRPWTIALSAHAEGRVRERVEAAGFDRYPAKPVRLQALEAGLSNLPASPPGQRDSTDLTSTVSDDARGHA
jgi:two-component system sensor histidine kinase BarA